MTLRFWPGEQFVPLNPNSQRTQIASSQCRKFLSKNNITPTKALTDELRDSQAGRGHAVTHGNGFHTIILSLLMYYRVLSPTCVGI